MKKTFIITGHARSGTSIASAILYKFGINMGDPKKSFDSYDDLLNLLGTDYKKIVDSKPDLWGIKYPRMKGHVIKSISKVVENPHLILVYRCPVATSLHLYDADNKDILNMVKDVTETQLEYSHILPVLDIPYYMLSYEKLLIKKERIIKELSSFCDINISDSEIKNISKLIKPEDKYKSINSLGEEIHANY